MKAENTVSALWSLKLAWAKKESERERPLLYHLLSLNPSAYP